ncbi:MAG TPA: twin-arginine translocase TatA/TatE family subunit [Acidimicrobiales bacterium]|nr:twin-arginine translocase TatA/TatE family subunit [Acidimicrobiales bacterium]
MPTSLGPAEIMVILVVALIVLGPKRLPEAGRQVGKAIAEVRKWSQGFQDEIRNVVEPNNSPPSYSQPQPGYTPPPIPVVPVETPPPGDGEASAPPAESNGSSVTTGTNGSVSGPAPVDSGPTNWADEPTYSDPPPTEEPGPSAGEPPRT